MFTWRIRQSTNRIIVHDSHTSPDLPSLYHWLLTNGRKNGLLHIGYHYVIERNGKVTRCRPVESVGSHTPGHNKDSVSFCVAGGFEGRCDHTPDALEAAQQLSQYLLDLYPNAQLVGHSEVQKLRNRQCPAFDVGLLRKGIPTMHPESDALVPKKWTEQHKIIMDVLKAGRTLTSQIALINLGIGSLSSRIAELRAMGHQIEDTWGYDMHDRRYKKYTLPKNVELQA